MRKFMHNVFIYGLLTFVIPLFLFNRYGQVNKPIKLDVVPRRLEKGTRSNTIVSENQKTNLVDNSTIFDTSPVENTTKPTTKPSKYEGCDCISGLTGHKYDFCYRNPKNASLIGKKFNCTFLSTIEDLGIIGGRLELVDIQNSERRPEDVIFVTAISKIHYPNFQDSYHFVHKHWPAQKVILYSLGDLDEAQIQNLEMDEMISVRKFNYSNYPPYVKNVMHYRFKPIILANSSIQMFINATHSNYAVLNEGLLDYFPTFSLDDLKTNERGLQLSAALVYVARTDFTMKVLKWHTLCALERRCMNPLGAMLECVGIPRWDVYAHCFRYDQSSLNLLLFNEFRDHNSYFMNVGKITRTYHHT